MEYGSWMAVVLASAGVGKEVEGVLREKNRGLGGRENRATGDGVFVAADDAGGDVAV